jgi:alcohol dehydrogenase class IV
MACGLDAVSQLIESYTSTRTDASVDPLAVKALSFAAESLLPLARGQSDDLALREKMSYAALVSGIMLSRCGLGAVHGLAGPLGGLCPIPHGVACGKLLFPTMTFVVKKVMAEKNTAAQKRFAQIGGILAGETRLNDARGCRQFLDVLSRWTQTFRLPPLSAFGMTAADMDRAVTLADCKNSPAILSPQEMKIILEAVR